MVCLCFIGGRLTTPIQAELEKAAQIHASGRLAASAEIYRRILEASPHEPDALHMLGVIAQQGGNSQQALQWFDAALTAKPDFLQARFNRSIVLRALGRNDEALQSVRAILKNAPDFAAAWDMAGQILKDTGIYDDAAKCYQHALSLQPGNARFHGNYALLLYALGDFRAAYAFTRKAESLDSSYPPMLLGNILRAWGHPEEAAKAFVRVRALIPNFADAYASEAMARLQMGDMKEGLNLWEKRPDLSIEQNKLPLWTGQTVRTLQLYEDQGIGDALQFMRYIPFLGTRAEKIVLRVRDPLVDLCRLNFSNLQVFSESEAPPKADARCRLSSLPHFFGTTLENIPSAPYLKAPEGNVWRKRLEALPAPHIGLVWAGNVKFRNDSQRSIDFQVLSPLLSCGVKHFVSLQKERSDLPPDLGVFDAAPELRNFADSAALIAELDLVITVDTATAHLAGALGKPVFVLLPFNSDWRWLIEREDSVWYPSARLFRQTSPGDWNSVIARLACDVHQFMDGNKDVIKATPWPGAPLRENPRALPLEI